MINFKNCKACRADWR